MPHAMGSLTSSLRPTGPEPAELSSIYARPEFANFLESSSKIVQRALSDGYDYLRDYTITGGSMCVSLLLVAALLGAFSAKEKANRRQPCSEMMRRARWSS